MVKHDILTFTAHTVATQGAKMPIVGKCWQMFSGMVDGAGKVTGAGGSRTLAMDLLWMAGGLYNGGCPSIRSLGP